jgi:MFS family permease
VTAEAIRPTASPAPIPSRSWFVLALLAVTGQIAWAVENLWFNTFVFDELTPDPRPVAWMVAASAITATLTTVFMGTLSDRARTRWGRRRPFILFGYILWGLSTIAFPTVAYIRVTALAVAAVVFADAMMTFFGSTANDAAFSAWTADIASSSTRGRVEGVLQIGVYVGQVFALVAAGVLIDRFGYFTFFYMLGAVVSLAGVLGGGLLRDAPRPAETTPRRSYWAEIGDLLRLDTLRNNRPLFILLLYIMVASTGMQVALPYLIVYLENFIGMTKSEFSIVGGAVLVGSALLALPLGLLADRLDRRRMLAAATVLSALGALLLSFMRALPSLALSALLWQSMSVAASIASVAWLKDLLPEDNRGKFLGLRMLFWIAIPMVVGPFIGSSLIRAFGIPTALEGEAGFIPAPIIFQVSALVTVLGLVPLLFMARQTRTSMADAQREGN